MLPLDSERWAELTTFFGDPADLPNVLRAWMAAAGSDKEEEDLIYRRDLFHMYLHQVTITNSAFAVVPWVVHVCEQGRTSFLAEYLMHVAFVEANRLKYGLYYHRKRTERAPDWLMDDYYLAIVKARNMVDDAVVSATDEEAKSGLIAMSPALYGDAEQAWKNYRHEK